ncbi:MAG: hypothetical protein R3B95_14740 [Nitrospirales bacterium]|nr:hypothetical protein [Nitrospirales bacterium]
MRHLSADELLRAWECALGQLPGQQALILLAVGYPEYAPEQLDRFSIGQRDALLLTLRQRLFGARFDSVTACPQCRQGIEVAFNVSDIRVRPATLDPIDSEEESFMLAMDGYRVDFRLPNSLDLLSLEISEEMNHGQEQLLRRCIKSVVREGADSHNGEGLDEIGRLPSTLIDAIAERMAQADPQADTRLTLSCPDCNYQWQAIFDIATYLMGEIHSWVKRILREVHNLASAYGWRERDILAMTPTRRGAYLELLGLG